MEAELISHACQATPLAAVVAGLWLTHSVFEYWIGKTKRVKASSTLELILTGIVSLAVILARKKKPDGDRI